jgi:redox-sensitive bicupin YhaK (pirin superfamily)
VLPVEAVERGHAIVVAAAPLREPIVFAGPFVMNTSEQVAQARADLEAGRLGGE